MEPNDELQLPQGLTQVQTVEFDGDRLTAVILEGEGVAVPVREYCGALGLDVDAQSARLREHEVLSRGLRVVRVRVGNRMRSVVAILHKYVPFWLATITPGLVKPEVREKLVRYQIEVAEILAGIYGGTVEAARRTTDEEPLDPLRQRLADAIREVRLARDALIEARQQTLADQRQLAQRVEERLEGQELRFDAMEGVIDALREQIATHTTITGPQQEFLSRSIRHLAQRYQRKTGKAIYDRLFAQFKLDLGTPRYDALPARRYDDALAWLRERAAELLPGDPEALPPQQEALL
jgi:hypothetical protein